MLHNASVLDYDVPCEVIGLNVEAPTEEGLLSESGCVQGRKESESRSTEYPCVVLKSVGMNDGRRRELFNDHWTFQPSTMAKGVMKELHFSLLRKEEDNCFDHEALRCEVERVVSGLSELERRNEFLDVVARLAESGIEYGERKIEREEEDGTGSDSMNIASLERVIRPRRVIPVLE